MTRAAKTLRRFALAISTTAGLALLAAGWAAQASAEPIIVGQKASTEQALLARMTARLLDAAGLDAEEAKPLGTAALRAALINGRVDIVWDYTGTSLVTYHRIRRPHTAAETYFIVSELDAEEGLIWLFRSAVQNSFGLAMRRDVAYALGITSIDDLATLMNRNAPLRFATTDEFFARPDGLKPMQTAYRFKFDRSLVTRMHDSEVYDAVWQGLADVGSVATTDASLTSGRFVVLRDDRGYFPAYELAPVVRRETLNANPDIAKQLNALASALTTSVITRLNAQVEMEGRSLSDVAGEFLESAGLP